MIYRSQEPLRILGDLSDDVQFVIRRVKENSAMASFCKGERYAKLPRLEKPLERGDVCFVYANSQFYVINCGDRGS